MSLIRFVYLVTVLVAATTATHTTESDQKNLRNHLGEIRAILDEAHDPCGNFPKYSCGNFHNHSGGAEDYPNDRVYLSTIADELNKLTDIKLEATRKAKDFLESCQKHQSPKNILKKVEVFKNPAEFKLAKTLGILKTSGIDTILRTNINVLDEKKFRVIIALDQDLFLSNVFNEKRVKRNLELLEVPAAERADAEKKINAFILKGQTLLTNSKEAPIVGHDPKAIKNFDWDEYLNELKKLPSLNKGSIEFILEDIIDLQKIIDLVHETDLQTLRLVTALEFMAEVIETGCDVVVDYFRMPLFSEFYRLYFKPADKAFNLDVLKEFENSQKNIKSKLSSQNHGVISRTQEKRRIIETMDQFLDGKRIDEEFKDIAIEKDNFYQNYLNLAKSKIFKYLSKENSKDDVAEQYLLNLLNPVNRMKPAFYHFSTQGLYLWQLFFRENGPKYSYDDLRDCLEAQQDKYKLFEFNDFEYFEYVEQFAAMKQTYSDFKRYWDQEYDPTHKLDPIFKDFHLTSDQAFFLNLAQRECSQAKEGKNLPFRIMLNMEEVSRAFNCPPGSQLNIPDKCAAW